MYRLNISYITDLPRTLGLRTLENFLSDWGRNKSVWYRLVKEENISMVHILDLCNRYGLSPSSFFVNVSEDGKEETVTAQSQKGCIYGFSFSLSNYVKIPNKGNVKWLTALSSLPYSYGKKARMLNAEQSRMESKDVVAICNATGITPSQFFRMTDTSNDIKDQINLLQMQLNALKDKL